MHRGKVDPGVSELSRDHVNRPLDPCLQVAVTLNEDKNNPWWGILMVLM